MPPKPKTKDEVAQERKLILDSALEIITNQSVNELSMRKLAKQLGYSATKLYYYFECKGEIVLALIEDGFYELNSTIEKDLSNINSPKEKFISLIDSIRRFSIEQSYYFNVMYGINVQRLDEVGEKKRVSDNRYFENESKYQSLFYNRLFDVTSNFAKQFNKANCEALSFNVISQITGLTIVENTNVLSNYSTSNDGLYDTIKQNIIKTIEE